MRLPSLQAMLGADAESRALRHLQRAGLKLVTRNWRCKRGELDLVMHDGDTLVFVEVRSRSRSNYGGALQSIDTRKQQRIIHAARAYLAAHPHEAQRLMRFDVVAFEDHAQALWIRQAFDAVD